MSVKISFNQSDYKTVKERHSERVADRLLQKIKDKNKTLEWKSSFGQCQSRFYNVIGSKGYFFPEMNLNPNGKQYRALLVWIEEENKIEFICAFRKADRYQLSKQANILSQVESHPNKIVEQAKESVQQKSTHTTSPRA